MDCALPDDLTVKTRGFSKICVNTIIIIIFLNVQNQYEDMLLKLLLNQRHTCPKNNKITSIIYTNFFSKAFEPCASKKINQNYLYTIIKLTSLKYLKYTKIKHFLGPKQNGS